MPKYLCVHGAHQHDSLENVVTCEFARYAQAIQVILDQGKTANEAAAVTGLAHRLYPPVEPVDFGKN